MPYLQIGSTHTRQLKISDWSGCLVELLSQFLCLLSQQLVIFVGGFEVYSERRCFDDQGRDLNGFVDGGGWLYWDHWVATQQILGRRLRLTLNCWLQKHVFFDVAKKLLFRHFDLLLLFGRLWGRHRWRCVLY